MKKLFFVCLAITLTACETFQPNLGMSVEQFRSNSAGAFQGYPDLIAANGRRSVYQVRGQNTIYIFENDRLISIKQGDAAQIRYQLELINK